MKSRFLFLFLPPHFFFLAHILFVLTLINIIRSIQSTYKKVKDGRLSNGNEIYKKYLLKTFCRMQRLTSVIYAWNWIMWEYGREFLLFDFVRTSTIFILLSNTVIEWVNQNEVFWLWYKKFVLSFWNCRAYFLIKLFFVKWKPFLVSNFKVSNYCLAEIPFLFSHVLSSAHIFYSLAFQKKRV